MKILKNGIFTGERALFNSQGVAVHGSVFEDGESPLKESADIEVYTSEFRWKYPLWYCKNVKVEDTALTETARSGIWYTKNINMKNCRIDAPKTFRRSEDITLTDCTMKNALESLWSCKRVTLKNVTACGDYFGMGAENVYAENLNLDGNYCFDGGKNIEIRNSRLNSKDSFWNCENVVVYDSVIIGEYLGWNSKNLTFINCTMESNQGFCYIESLKIEGSSLKNTDLAFEYSTVDAEINGKIDSVKNPISGRIKAGAIGEIILDGRLVDPDKTEIITEGE